MFEKLEMFQMAQGLARHASARQGTVAENIANADTPGYRAKDIKSFAESYQHASDDSALRATRPEHRLTEQDASLSFERVDTPDASSPNGNTVALENEMMKATEVRHQHDLALAIYKSSMNILRTSIGRR